MRRALPSRLALLLGAVGTATLAGLWAGAGSPAVAAAPVLAVALGWAVLRLPVRVSAAALLFLALVLENPQNRPADGIWKSPLFPLGQLYFDNLSKTLGVGGLSFSLLDLGLVGLLVLALVRRAEGRGAAGDVPAAEPLTGAVALFALTLALMGAWGFLRGWDGQAAYWQVRQLAFFPFAVLLFVHAFRGPRDLALVGGVVVAAAVLRSLLGMYVAWAVAGPRGLTPAFVTDHGDTVLFVGALLAVGLYWLEARTFVSRVLLLSVAPTVMVGIFLNDRRLAWVCLGASALALVWAMPRTRLRRAVLRLGVVLAPLLALYVAVGLGSGSRAAVFAPLQSLSSVSDAENDSSTRAREVENYNLARTVEQSPLVGSGWGHGYRIVVQGDDISKWFALFRFIPHNGVLWLLSVGGVLGFSGLFTVWGVAVFLAVRSYSRGRTPLERAAALGSLGLVLTFLLQVFGDMGTQIWTPVLLGALGAALPAKLAVAVGAYPAPGAARPASATPLHSLTSVSVASR